MNPLGNEVFFNCVFPSMEEANRCGYGRVENIDLYIRIASVCRVWQEWVFSTRGPFRALKNVIAISAIHYKEFQIRLEDNTQKVIRSIPLNSLRVAMGLLNHSLKEHSMGWFDYIDKIKLGQSAEPPENCNPNVHNFNNETPFSLTITIILAAKDKEKYEFLVDKLYKAGTSADTIAKALPEIFSWKFEAKAEPKDQLQLADTLIAKIKEMTKNHGLHAAYLQERAGQILCITHEEDFSEPYGWLLKNEIKLTPDHLADFLSHAHPGLDNSIGEIFSQIINTQGFPVNGVLQDGDHLIHKLDGGMFKYLNSLLKVAPEEIFAKDEEGKSFLWSLPLNLTREAIIPIDVNLYWKHRKECHDILVNKLKKFRIWKSNFNDDINKRALSYLNIIKYSFSSDEDFEKWLIDPNDDNECLLHHIAKWSPTLIHQLLKQNFITKNECLKENCHHHNVFYLSRLYRKFYNGDYTLKNAIFLEKIKQETPLFFESQRLGDFFMAYFFDGQSLQREFTGTVIENLLKLQGYHVTDHDGNTLLHRLLCSSVCRYYLKDAKHAIEYLLDHGVDPTIVNNKNETAFSLAEQKGLKELLPMLQLNSKVQREINKELNLHSMKWFEYINAIRRGDDVQSPPSTLNPNGRNDYNDTPFSIAVLIALQNKKNQFLLEKLFEAGVSIDTILETLPKIFSWDIVSECEDRFELADILIAKIQAMNKDDCAPAIYLQKYVDEILRVIHQDTSKPFRWLLEKKVQFTIDHLAYCVSRILPCLRDEKFFSKMINVQGVRLDATLKCGDHLIHKFIPHNLGYLDEILKIAPEEIFAKNKDGNAFLWLLAEKRAHEKIANLTVSISTDLFWKHRNECHDVLLKNLQHSKTTSYGFKDDKNEDALFYLELIKQSFNSNGEFEEWLVHSGDKESLLHQIAVWSPALIDLMLQRKFITKEECLRKDCLGLTVLDLSEVYEIFYSRKFKLEDVDFLKKIKQKTPLYFNSDLLANCFMAHFNHCKNDKHCTCDLKFTDTLVDDLLKLQGYHFADSSGNTLLHRLLSLPFCPNKRVHMKHAIAYLIDHGVDPHIVNNHKKTASMLAKENGWSELLPMIQ